MTACIRRRGFITLLGGAAAWPFAARAQQPDQMRRIGVLMGFAEGDREGQTFVAAFRDGLRQLGWIEGRNIQIDRRWATANDPGSIPRLANDLVALQPDLILSHSTPTTAALLKQTRNIPIIFSFVSDPLGSGFVQSFREPSGNATCFIVMEPTMAGKWLFPFLGLRACFLAYDDLLGRSAFLLARQAHRHFYSRSRRGQIPIVHGDRSITLA